MVPKVSMNYICLITFAYIKSLTMKHQHPHPKRSNINVIKNTFKLYNTLYTYIIEFFLQLRVSEPDAGNTDALLIHHCLP